MSEKKGRLFVFSAPSGAGKTTIVRDVLKQFPELIFSISATTRKKRPSEVEGEDYFFISKKEFEDKINNGNFVEWEEFYDYYYGTLKSFVDENINDGRSVVFEVDVKGALSIKETYPDSVLIFIAPPSLDELKKRLIERKTETEEDLKKRIERAEMELGFKDKFDHIIYNDDLEKAKRKAKSLIKNYLSEEK